MTGLEHRTDIVVLTIRDDEYTAVLNRLGSYEIRPIGQRTYALGRVLRQDGKALVVAAIRTPAQGPSAAQDTTRDAIEDLDPDWIAVVGIGGAIPDREFTLGDVIVGSRLHDFSVGAYIEGSPPEFASQGGPMHKRSEDLISLLPALARDLQGWHESIALPRPVVDCSSSNFYGDESWKQKTREALDFHFKDGTRRTAPTFSGRAIASSGFLVKDAALVQHWRTVARDLAAIEMELSGVYQSARRRTKEYPILAIRGISDIVGFKRDPAWTNYACHSAAAFLVQLLKRAPDSYFSSAGRSAPATKSVGGATPHLIVLIPQSWRFDCRRSHRYYSVVAQSGS